MFYTIYKTINLINNKIYIGKHQTKDLDDGYKGSGKILKRSIVKHGVENFKKEILFIFDNEIDMNAKEKELVTEEFCLREDTYNVCPGGNGGFGYINANGLNGTAAGRKKSGDKLKVYSKNIRQDPIFVQTISETISRSNKNRYLKGDLLFLNKYHHLANTPEAIEKKKKTFLKINHQQGNKNSQFGTCWMFKDEKNIKVNKKDVDIYLKQGYVKGRKIII